MVPDQVPDVHAPEAGQAVQELAVLDQERPVAAAPEVEDVSEQDEGAAVDRLAGLEELEKRRDGRVGVARMEVGGDEDHGDPVGTGPDKDGGRHLYARPARTHTR